MLILCVFLVFASLIGVLGRNCRFGFWGFFFASLMFTPLGGALLLIAALAGKKK